MLFSPASDVYKDSLLFHLFRTSKLRAFIPTEISKSSSLSLSVKPQKNRVSSLQKSRVRVQNFFIVIIIKHACRLHHLPGRHQGLPRRLGRSPNCRFSCRNRDCGQFGTRIRPVGPVYSFWLLSVPIIFGFPFFVV